MQANFVYEVTVGHARERYGIYETPELARTAVETAERDGPFQINRIARNDVNYFGESFDCVSCMQQ